jgi:hypothetical protein
VLLGRGCRLAIHETGFDRARGASELKTFARTWTTGIWLPPYVSVGLGFQLTSRTLGRRSHHVGSLLGQRRRIAVNVPESNSARRQAFEIRDVADKADHATYANNLVSPRLRG